MPLARPARAAFDGADGLHRADNFLSQPLLRQVALAAQALDPLSKFHTLVHGLHHQQPE
jgi:hypothetical protein